MSSHKDFGELILSKYDGSGKRIVPSCNGPDIFRNDNPLYEMDEELGYTRPPYNQTPRDILNDQEFLSIYRKKSIEETREILKRKIDELRGFGHHWGKYIIGTFVTVLRRNLQQFPRKKQYEWMCDTRLWEAIHLKKTNTVLNQCQDGINMLELLKEFAYQNHDSDEIRKEISESKDLIAGMNQCGIAVEQLTKLAIPIVDNLNIQLEELRNVYGE